MIGEVRTDHTLISVKDTGSKAAKKVADLLARTIDFSIPGFGIIHDPKVVEKHKVVHKRHLVLLLNALVKVEPPVCTTDYFHNLGLVDFRDGEAVHTDSSKRLEANKTGRQEMILRLHTTDALHPADVTLVSSAQRVDMNNVGDADLYANGQRVSSFISDEFGYDPNLDRLCEDDYFDMIEDGIYDPIYFDPRVYHFRQRPLASVVFRTKTSMGPVTAHGFRATQPKTTREVFASDLMVYGQFAGEPDAQIAEKIG